MPRLFIAMPIPAPITETLLDTMEGVDNARWQDADNLHVTLRFLGEVDVQAADDLHVALERVRAAPFALEIAGVGHFEKRHRSHAHSKAIWAGIAPCPALANLVQKVEMACRSAGLEAETRKFVPHVTLARLNRSSGDISGWLTRHAKLRAPPWEVRKVALFASHLTPGGASYEILETYPLSAR